MIKHIVCFKLVDSSEDAKKEAASVLLSMAGNVPQIKGIEVGVDFLCSARSYDVILEVLVDDQKALDEYQNDPYHCEKVKTYMHAKSVASVSVDCVLD